VNLFDIVGGTVLVVSTLLGFSRGAVQEIVALVAFTAAAALAVWLLPYTGPFAQATVHPAWASNAVAVAVCFLIAYFAIRFFGNRLSQSLHGHATLGPLDRTAGLAFGVVRALVLLGVVFLVFKATPSGQPPPLIADAKIYPLARGAGLTLARLAPGGMDRLEDFGASLKARMIGEQPQPPQGPVDAGLDHGPTPSGLPSEPPPPTQRTLRVESDGDAPPHHHHHHPRPSAASQE
jgi:membrane protein required for colicin V production